MRSLALASLLALASIKLGKSAGLTKAEQAIFAREHARAHAENNASIVSGARMFFDVRIFGQNPIMLPVATDVQESFEDPGATCVDENGHQDTNLLQQTGDKVVLSKPGVYSIMYRCPDTIWQERIVVVSKQGNECWPQGTCCLHLADSLSACSQAARTSMLPWATSASRRTFSRRRLTKVDQSTLTAMAVTWVPFCPLTLVPSLNVHLCYRRCSSTKGTINSECGLLGRPSASLKA